MFGSVAGDGTGQTIAIVDAYNEPTLKADLAAFDSQFGLAAAPSFVQVNQTGGSSLPASDSPGGWGLETALDVEWAHSIAPGANLVLVEATTDSDANLYAAVDEARSYAGVSAVSMSWGGDEGVGGLLVGRLAFRHAVGAHGRHVPGRLRRQRRLFRRRRLDQDRRLPGVVVQRPRRRRHDADDRQRRLVHERDRLGERHEQRDRGRLGRRDQQVRRAAVVSEGRRHPELDVPDRPRRVDRRRPEFGRAGL